MKLPIKPSMVIVDGIHKGTIIAIEYKTEPYLYTDVVIEMKDNRARIWKY